jgi:hypothetical protein
MQFSDLLSFEKFVTPTLVKIIYWLGIAAIVLAGLFGFFASLANGALGTALLGLIFTLLGLLGWRVLCEIYIVVFGMFERLGSIRDALGGQPSPSYGQAPQGHYPYAPQGYPQQPQGYPPNQYPPGHYPPQQ